MDYLIQMKDITMRFAGVTALDNVSFDLRPGEVHVLLGENGAGKSTLVKILSGINVPSAGTIEIGGQTLHSLTPATSKENKVAIIYQELSVIDELSIAENLFVGQLPVAKGKWPRQVDYKLMYARAHELIERVGLHKPVTTLVQELSISEKQQVEIAKALAVDAQVIIMDEPTSSLSIEETEDLFKIIRQLKQAGIGIIYISHKLKEIKQIGDRVSVLKDGKYVGTRLVSDVEVEDLIPMMVGRDVRSGFLRETPVDRAAEVVFSVKGLTRTDLTARDISFDVHKGEILGFAGLIGAGRSECMEGIFGAKPISKGQIFVKGKQINIKDPYHALSQGIALVTENRRETGFFQNFEIWREISVTTNLRKSKHYGFTGFTNEKGERQVAERETSRIRTKCSGIGQMTAELSGGNQQKVIISKWLAVDSDVFIFDEPTKGIDVGAKSEIYAIMRSMAENGKAVIMVSSDMPELLGVCDRIIVFRAGEISAVFSSEEATEEKIMFAAVTTH